jgi:hypothetical protein
MRQPRRLGIGLFGFLKPSQSKADEVQGWEPAGL